MPDPLSRAGLERFAEVAAAHVGPDKVPGLGALVACHEQVHVEVLGELQGREPVRRDSLFRIASTTKVVTGAATMALVDDGVLALEEPVERWLPELAQPRVLRRRSGPLDDTVPAAGPITVRQLLTFTFGFGAMAEMFATGEHWPVVERESQLSLATLGPPAPDVQPEPDTWIARLGSLPLLAQPGERWMYNTGASVLGVLAARATGSSYPQLLQRRIFEPLGMRDTAFWTADRHRLATAYMPAEGGLSVWDPPDGRWSRPPAFPDGASGLVSTLDDLYAFARMFLAGGSPVLSREAVSAMTKDQLTPRQRAGTADVFLDGRGWSYCQSVIREGERVGAFGWDGGLGTSWLVDPRRDLVVIVLTQRMWESPALPAVHRELQAAAYDALTWPAGRDAARVRPSPAA